MSADAMALMLRSHKLKVEEVPSSCRCVARCGAGTNNIPVKELTQMVRTSRNTRVYRTETPLSARLSTLYLLEIIIIIII